MLEWVLDPSAWVALATLTLLEIVLGIDNIIFISILVGRLPEAQRQKARILGLGLAMGTRILLLLSLAWVMRLTDPLFTVLGEAISGRDLILLLGACSSSARVPTRSTSPWKGRPSRRASAKRPRALSAP